MIYYICNSNSIYFTMSNFWFTTIVSNTSNQLKKIYIQHQEVYFCIIQLANLLLYHYLISQRSFVISSTSPWFANISEIDGRTTSLSSSPSCTLLVTCNSSVWSRRWSNCTRRAASHRLRSSRGSSGVALITLQVSTCRRK